jgi:hypothetical protein
MPRLLALHVTKDEEFIRHELIRFIDIAYVYLFQIHQLFNDLAGDNKLYIIIDNIRFESDSQTSFVIRSEFQ